MNQVTRSQFDAFKATYVTELVERYNAIGDPPVTVFYDNTPPIGMEAVASIHHNYAIDAEGGIKGTEKTYFIQDAK